MKDKKNGTPDNFEDESFNYEQLLNEFVAKESGDDDGKRNEDGYMLSELLKGIESRDDSKKDAKGAEADDFMDIDLENPDFKLEDIGPEETAPSAAVETEEESFPIADIGKKEIDLGDFGGDLNSDYSSLLSKLESSDLSEPEEEAEKVEPVGLESLDIGQVSLDSVEEPLESAEEPEAGESEPIPEPLEEPVESHTVPQTAAETEEVDLSFADFLNEDMEKAQEGAEEEPRDHEVQEEPSYASLLKEDKSESLESEESPQEETVELETDLTEDSVFSVEGSAVGQTVELPEETAFEDDASLAAAYESDSDAGAEEVTIDKEFNLSEDDEELLPTDDSSKKSGTATAGFSAVQEESFVISGGGEEASEEDFLKLDIEQPSDRDAAVIAGVTDFKAAVLTEILLDGIKMDIGEQISAVTRAELLFGMGKKKEAANILISLSKNHGVTPRVAKLLEQFQQ